MKKVLLVIENAELAEVYKQGLVQRGHEIMVVGDISEASRQAYLAFKPEVIVFNEHNPDVKDLTPLERMNRHSAFVKDHYVRGFPPEVVYITTDVDYATVLIRSFEN